MKPEDNTDTGQQWRGDEDRGASFAEIAGLLRGHIKLLLALPLAAGMVALAVASLLPPTFTATATLLPPQQSQGAAASVLAGLGPLAGLVGGATSSRGGGDQYVALMQSVNVSDRIIDQFDLVKRYDTQFRQDARQELAKNVRIGLGKKDGLISITVDDQDAKVAADMANRYVDELRRITSTLAVTEAQQRRLFFEKLLTQARQQLTKSQQELQATGFSLGALKSEPRAAAENYARLKAGIAGAEVKLQALRGNLTEAAPEVRQQLDVLSTLRRQLAQSEETTDPSQSPDYVGRYREYKYQEALFEVYARQFELARVDESREGAIVQVVDAATPPERKSKPRRGQIAAATTLITLVLLVAGLLARHFARRESELQS
jgi:uncharacterized protein involved in exopolysaccharide biosynthesis